MQAKHRQAWTWSWVVAAGFGCGGAESPVGSEDDTGSEATDTGLPVDGDDSTTGAPPPDVPADGELIAVEPGGATSCADALVAYESEIDWIGDFDGDGREDIAGVELDEGAGTAHVLVWYGSPEPLVGPRDPSATIDLGQAPRLFDVAELGDLDGDGHADFAVGPTHDFLREQPNGAVPRVEGGGELSIFYGAAR